MTPTAAELGRRPRERDLSAAPAALNLIEDRSRRQQAAGLLAEVSPAALGGEAQAHLIGITGPPGAGKSSLLSALVAEWRCGGRRGAGAGRGPPPQAPGGGPAPRPRRGG